MYHTKAWLNGEYLGEHIDGYLPFAFDVTGKLKTSDEPSRPSRGQPPRIDWIPAAKQIEWVQYGGILQPVRLESTRQDRPIIELVIRASRGATGAAITCDVEVEIGHDIGCRSSAAVAE